MGSRKRNTALLLIAAGLYIILGKAIGFFAVSSVVLIWLGLYRIRSSGDKRGYVPLAIGVIVLLNSQLFIVLAIILISIGWFFIKSRREQRNSGHFQRHRLLESLNCDRDPWVMKSVSLWSLIGEIRLDVSLALWEEEETVLVLQGVVGDVHILVPEDLEVDIEASVTIGQVHVSERQEAGLINRVVWQSPNSGSGRRRLKLIASYLVGDINVKVI